MPLPLEKARSGCGPPWLDPARYAELKASGRLPSPRGMALAIIQLLQREDYRIEELVRLVQSDPAIAGRVLRFANTAACAAVDKGRPIVSLAKAVATLGTFRVRDVVLAFSVLNGHRRGSCEVFDYEAFWSHSLATAIAAQFLAQHAQMAPDESFTVGLLCDVGRLGLATLYPDRYGGVIQASAGDRQRLLKEEERAFGLDHRRLGACLLTEWGLPAVLVAATFHSQAPNQSGLPEGSRPHTLALSLQLAQAVADICVAADEARWSLVPTVLATAAQLGIEPAELEATVDRVVASWREWGLTLQIQTRDLPSLAQMISDSPAFLAEPMTEQAAAARPALRALLIVARDTLAAELTQILAAEGYTVDVRASGLDGLMQALHERPALVMIDIDAAELSGPSFCTSLRATEAGRDAHLVVVADTGRERELIAYLDAGADDFLEFPISAAAVRAWVKSMTRIRQLQGQIRLEREGLIRSAGEWAESRQRLLRLAHTDTLTHLPNRRYGLDFLATEFALARAGDSALACLMIDIDHFKLVNDRYGHETGDQVLAGVAARLQETCRREDFAFRLGGEEFCVVCHGSDSRSARAIAERIRRSIQAARFGAGDPPVQVTVSIGVAARSAPHEQPDDLVREADAALYQAKQAGRNRVVCA